MFKGKVSKVLVFGLACMAVVAMLALSACGGGSSQSSSSRSSSAADGEYKLVTPGTLTVATSPDYAPMEYQENGEIKGYDIALIKEIAKHLGLNADIQNQAFDSLVTQVAGGKTFDCAISSITISDERAEQVAFTDAYYDSNLAIVVLKDSDVTSRDALNGQPIGAQSGSSGEDWAKENLKDSAYTPFQETPDMLAALRTGKIKAVIYDEPAAAYNIAHEYDDCTILEVIPTGEQYGIIVNTDNVALAEAINNALAAMQADGTIAKLQEEWFGAAK